MSAAITYHGVPGAQGTLFRETSFFVTQRVPDRKNILDLITQNGGKIVKLDKQADMVIADHVRPDCPLGSLHWKFIKDSVDNGALQETDKYLIHPSPVASRAVGHSRSAILSAPIKGTRTPFNTADDASLTKWVLSHPPNKRSGNEIYKAFEGVNNRHTSQSWRDRWVKKVSKLSQAALESLAASAPEAQPPVPSPTPSSTRRAGLAQAGRRRSPSRITSPAARSSAPETHRVRDFQEADVKAELTPTKKFTFTKTENDLLLQEAREHGPPFTTRFFQEFAERHPVHSWAVWKRHWTDVLKSRLDEDIEDEPPLPKEPRANNISSPDTGRSNEPSRHKEMTRQPGRISDIQNLGPVAPPVEAVVKEDDGKKTSEPQRDGEVSQGVSREDFFDHLKAFREYGGLDAGINPEVNGQPIDIWLLWQAVRGQYQQGGVEIDWEAAATALGLQSEASQPLKQCYTEYVADFAASGMLDESDAESEDDESEVELPPQDPRSDVLIATSQKRPALAVETSVTPSTPSNRKKRQRLGANDEIPSTPDERLGIASFGNLGPSPSLSAGRVFRRNYNEEDMEIDGNLEQPLIGRGPRFEPETQDFAFAFEASPQQDSQVSGEFDISPSQQLLSEVDAVTPVPLSFRDKGKSSERVPVSNPVLVRNLQALAVEEAVEEAVREQTERAIPDSQESADKTAELEDLIDRFDSFGYSREDIVTVLNATSLCTPLATDVLKFLKQHKELPHNWQGVWTENDDKRLRRVDDADQGAGPDRARLQKYWDYLVKKHMPERIERRREFLAYLDEIAESSQ
ncbi:Putative TRF2-interacting telomeric protein/Rap1 [Colletotrichum destructivum]|uniref:DNA-binding protein RAP1 n=1 Tax=Colletotrichum destructivum TaxID=34406 RepID=A0AAX4ISE8_9PEZI|nr:Putative TRF2-interacting telomeric protein/Rap1 [Colletotrichum destructivum]